MYGLRCCMASVAVVYVMQGSRTYPTDQVTGEAVDWIVPKSTANANTVYFLYSNVRTIHSMSKEATYGEMDANAVDPEFVRMPFVWNPLRVVSSKSICHVMRGCDCIDVEQK